ncbi:MAG TPA: Dabb family protein [Chthonomonadaceae bacterium]|nr:Dabb family protein [Chthonomonadaceae bacterium]
MIEHIVLFRWQNDAAPEAIAAAVEALRGLKDTVPGILDLSCGENFSDRAQGYTHGLVVRFPDRAALEAYGPHPNHQHVVQNFINPIRAEVLALDFEF